MTAAVCPSSLHHDTRWAYRHGCRCPDTVELTRAHWREASRRARLKTPRTGAAGPGRGRAQYVDTVAVDRAMRGDPVRLTVLERSIAVHRMTGQPYKLSAREIGRRLRVTPRTVVRYRSGEIRHGIPSNQAAAAAA